MAHPKGLLIERAQKLGLERPEFATVKTGPEHEPSFLSDVILEGEVLGTGQGGSKKDAEKAAAEEALAALEKRPAGAATSDAEEERGGRRRGGGTSGRGSRSGGAERGREERAEPAADSGTSASEEEDEVDDEQFDGPWPMFDDLLASALEVAERRIPSHLHGEDARVAIRDFSLALYKELLANLGEVVEEDEEEEDEED